MQPETARRFEFSILHPMGSSGTDIYLHFQAEEAEAQRGQLTPSGMEAETSTRRLTDGRTYESPATQQELEDWRGGGPSAGLVFTQGWDSQAPSTPPPERLIWKARPAVRSRCQ